jgi:hypothetical protein
MKNKDVSTEGVISSVQKLGHIFSFNSVGGVIGICKTGDVSDAYDRYLEKVRQRVIPASDKVTLLVDPTITFAETEEYLRPVHSAILEHNGCDLVKRILEKMYGGPINFDLEDKMDLKCLVRMRDMLFKRDSRIYVPFAGDSSPAWQFYSRYTHFQALELILKDIPVL